MALLVVEGVVLEVSLTVSVAAGVMYPTPDVLVEAAPFCGIPSLAIASFTSARTGGPALAEYRARLIRFARWDDLGQPDLELPGQLCHLVRATAIPPGPGDWKPIPQTRRRLVLAIRFQSRAVRHRCDGRAGLPPTGYGRPDIRPSALNVWTAPILILDHVCRRDAKPIRHQTSVGEACTSLCSRNI
ncbi:hypothetical protein B0H14DRAFT_3442410 [Mycena olivaceomarginata]|nr:hypothetical protein B0H14DRAFT_3442410 [Mycena olivaceomarginata]